VLLLLLATGEKLVPVRLRTLRRRLTGVAKAATGGVLGLGGLDCGCSVADVGFLMGRVWSSATVLAVTSADCCWDSSQVLLLLLSLI